MNEFVLQVVVIALLVLLLIILGLWLRLRSEQRQLAQDYQLLVEQIQRHNGDVVGLCSAAIAVDQRLSACEKISNQLLERMNQQPVVTAPVLENFSPAASQLPEPLEDEPQGYDQAIRRIRLGATVEELVKHNGLTRDEAKLLIRLHGRG